MNTDTIVSCINSFYGLDIREKTRKQEYIEPRQIASYFLKNLTNLYCKEIAPIVGVRHYSTIIVHVEEVSEKMKDVEYRNKVNQIELLIKHKNKMKIINQVCSLEQSVKLFKLGLLQESIFHFDTDFSVGSNIIKYSKNKPSSSYCFSAYTVGELCIMMPASIYDFISNKWYYYRGFDHHIVYRSNQNTDLFSVQWKSDPTDGHPYDTEAQARAALLISIVSNNLEKLDIINNRLSKFLKIEK
jgi:hypothetical protein